MEIWKKNGDSLTKKPTLGFPNKKSLDNILSSRFLNKEHHYLVFTDQEEQELTKIAKSLSASEGTKLKSSQRFLEIFMRETFRGMPGPCPIELVTIKDAKTQGEHLAFEFFKP